MSAEIRVVSEDEAAQTVTMAQAIEAVREAFIALDEGRAEVFPVSIGSGSRPGDGLATKGGRIDGRALGVKVGTYWPGNPARGESAHGSTVLLLDDASGRPLAVIGATHLTALRTAAADAVAVDALAPTSASRLAVVGTGHQAYFDTFAIAQVRDLDQVVVWGRRPDQAAALAARLQGDGMEARAESSLPAALDGADLVTTVTSSCAPVLGPELPSSVVHISAMGADAHGKQELAVELVTRARCVADVPEQSLAIGELQHAAAQGKLDEAAVTPLGAVLRGRLPGRLQPDQLMIFDSSGTAVQDLAVCALVLEALS